MEIQEIKDHYTKGIPKFFYKKIPKDQIVTEKNKLIYFIDHLGIQGVGIVKIMKKDYFEVKELTSKQEHYGIYEFDQIALVPEKSKDFKKFKKYLND